MFGELDESFIMSSDDLDNGSLFAPEDEAQELQDTQPEQNEEQDKDKKTTEDKEIDGDNLFSNPESVGSEGDKSDEGDTVDFEESGTSPNNFYSTTAKAFKDDGIFPSLDDTTIENIKSAEDFAEAIEGEIRSKLDDRQKRIDEALNAGVETNDIRIYENTIHNLSTITEELITDEGDKGENLRKNLIYQDYINRGYTEERAQREIKKSFDAGTDIEDAKEALESNKTYFQDKYQEIIDEAKAEEKAYKESLAKEAADLKKSMLEDKEIFKGIILTPKVRKAAYDNITKPIHKTDDGMEITAIQKYEKENPVLFRKYLSVLFTLTDSFTNIDSLVKPKVQEKYKRSLRELEHKVNSTSRNSFGNPTFVGSVDDDKESYAGKGWDLDV